MHDIRKPTANGVLRDGKYIAIINKDNTAYDDYNTDYYLVIFFLDFLIINLYIYK